MNKKQLSITTLVGVCLMAMLLAACSNTELEEAMPDHPSIQPAHAILFAPAKADSTDETAWNDSLGDTVMSRGTMLSDANFDQFYVYGAQTNGDFSASSFLRSPNFIFGSAQGGAQVNKVNGRWSYGEVKYWPLDPNQKLTFFAFSEQLPQGKISVSSDNQSVLIHYPFSNDISDVASQKDLIMASAHNQTYNTNNGVVNLRFRHLLSALDIRVKREERTSISFLLLWEYRRSDYRIQIENVRMLNFYKEGDLSLNIQTGEVQWQNIRTATIYNNVSVDKTKVYDGNNNDSYQTIFSDPSKYILFLPQTVPSDAQIEITYRVVSNIERNGRFYKPENIVKTVSRKVYGTGLLGSLHTIEIELGANWEHDYLW